MAASMFRRAAGLARSYWHGGSFRTARAGGYLGRWAGAARAPLMAAGGAFDVGVLAGKTMLRAGGRTLNWAGKHPMMATTVGMGTIGTVGAVRGMYDAGRNIRPLPPANRPLPAGGGPGYNTWGSPRRGPMQPNNLGATGDLALSLHSRRHR